MTQIQEINGNGQKLQANFDAFKFPTSDVVQFRALVTPCIPRCDPVKCDGVDYLGQSHSTNSYGKRRKRRDLGDETKPDSNTQRPNSRKMPTPVELKVASLIHITDKFDESSVLDDKSKLKTDAKLRTENDSNSTNHISSNLGTYYPSQDWEHTFESDEKCVFDSEEKCANDIHSVAIGATIFLVAQCILIAIWVLIYHKQKQYNSSSTDLKGKNVDQNLNPWTKYHSWSRLNNKQNFLFDHSRSKSSIKPEVGLEKYHIEATYSDFDPYLPNAQINSSSFIDDAFQRKIPFRSTISTSPVTDKYDAREMQRNEQFTNNMGMNTERKPPFRNIEISELHRRQDLAGINKGQFGYLDPSSFGKTRSYTNMDHEPSSLSSISSFNSSSEESRITNSTHLSFALPTINDGNEDMTDDIQRRCTNQKLKSETHLKFTPVKPKRSSKTNTKDFIS